MTYRERLAIEHPELVYDIYEGGCCGCPSDYDYEPDRGPCSKDSDCTKCWDRDMCSINSLWIPCTDENATMSEEGEEVLCTLKEDWSYGKGTDVQHHVFEGEYKLTKEDCYDMPAANGKGYFEANNDWDEGQPLAVIAWMPKPVPYKE